MLLALALSAVLSAASDPAVAVVAAPPSAAPVPAPKTIDVDSIWGGSLWSAAVQFHSAPLQFGAVVDLEKEYVDNVGIQNYEFEVQAWRSLSNKLEVGLGYGHSWLIEVGGSNTGTPGIGVLVSSDAVMARGRYWAKRDRRWELGPQIGIGYSFGTLTRLSVVDEVPNSISSDGLSATELTRAQRSIDVSGPRVEAGLAMEILVHPRFSAGGVLRLSVNAWDGDDPTAYANATLDGAGYGNTTIGPELHAAYRF